MNPYKDVEESSFSASPRLAYEDIASKLLKDNLYLTALELHTELVENGKELPQLREFFSNPGNFEQHVTRSADFASMHRSPSQATLDSLDTARYSEDGGGDRAGSGGDVAVLEFELRKARETINALRANLTQFADGDSALDNNSKSNFNQRSLKPHEKRALNFLINEYLLLQNYKLTSITFSDENPDQEFEDWDDVGLNMPRPANLISLFWGSTTNMNVPKADASTATDMCTANIMCQTENDDVCLLIQAEEIELLKQKITALETEKLNFQKLYDAALVSLNSLTSPTSESKVLELQISSEKMLSTQSRLEQVNEIKPLTCTAMENHYGSGNSTHSATPEQFEMIYSEKTSTGMTKKDGSNTSSFEPGLITDSVRGSPVRRGSVTTLDETLSMNDASEWTRVHYDYNTIDNSKEMWIDSSLPNHLKESILAWCNETLDMNGPLANDLLCELVNSEKPITLPGLLPLVADTLPRVLPHTLVARRSEAAALLAAAAALLPPGDARRPRLLHSLLTLYKKPEPPDAKAVCEATCLVVKWGGSGEVLSSIAELLASRSPERRVLASQICLSIAPYVPIELCTSLLLSLVVLMCESSEPEIRSIGLKSACLICPVAEHKYGQLETIMFNFLKDTVDKNVKDTVNVFVPVLARSALIAGKFSSELCTKIMSNILKACTDTEWKTVILYLDVMRSLVIPKLAYVINVQIVKDANVNNCDMETINLQDVPLNEKFIDLQCYMTDHLDAKVLLGYMNSLLKDNEQVRWTELKWFINEIKQILEIATKSKALNHHVLYEAVITLFTAYVDNFGLEFTSRILRPIFNDIIAELENKLEKLHAVNVDSVVVVGVYLVTILIAIEKSEQRAEFLQKWVLYSSIRGLPVKIFSIPFKWLAKHKPDILYLFMEQLREFAASSCDSSSGSTIRVYIATLVTELLNLTDVEEECIEKQMLPAVVALLYDNDIAVREVAITAWGSVTRTCLGRGLACEEQCWAPFENILNAGAVSGREGARAAEALALLVLPTVDSHAVSERAVSLLCALCHARAAGECVCALAPALQLAAHHCAHHPTLLPALRKLEETVQTPSLAQYKPAIEALLHVVGSSAEVPRVPSPRPTTNLQAAQEVGRRVTQIFQQSKSNMNLQSIFKKKP
ncbi:RAB11-binding protein RELCH homolog isoform X2 [Bicyclus anynana]|uniref:RAB11-binding protein RELCH homolog isoform X2 n=1 Tax=Bicyclus anynana TaxID=110368 RepID=A0ABM3LRQ6_BICAN|nr:RAB11-binding protein RELCH homolog isoform X2 [Bicyclus anynana]